MDNLTGINTDRLKRLGGLLGHEVETPDGIGVLIAVSTPSHGICFEPERIRVIVWYGTDHAQNGWVSREYDPNEIKAWSTLLATHPRMTMKDLVTNP